MANQHQGHGHSKHVLEWTTTVSKNGVLKLQNPKELQIHVGESRDHWKEGLLTISKHNYVLIQAAKEITFKPL